MRSGRLHLLHGLLGTPRKEEVAARQWSRGWTSSSLMRGRNDDPGPRPYAPARWALRWPLADVPREPTALGQEHQLPRQRGAGKGARIPRRGAHGMTQILWLIN